MHLNEAKKALEEARKALHAAYRAWLNTLNAYEAAKDNTAAAKKDFDNATEN